MATTYTPNYNLAQPEVGGELDTWGGLLNADLATLDSVIKAVSNVANAALPKAGGTMTGALTLNNGSVLTLNAAAGNDRVIRGKTNGADRWALLLSGAGSETGGNAGSDFAVLRYSDGGSYMDAPLGISRATGKVTLSATDINGNLGVAGTLNTAGNITTAGTLSLGTFGIINGGTQVTIGPTSSGAVYLRPVNTGSSTGQVEVLPSKTTVSAPFAAVVGGSTPATPLSFGAQSHGPFGGGLYLTDPSASNGQWGLYLTANTLIFASGSSHGGTLTNRVTIGTSGVVTAADFAATSDRRLKEDFARIEDAVDRLNLIEPQLYTKGGRREAGVIAQDVQAVLAPAVYEGEDGYLRVSHGQLQALVIAAVQELDQRLRAVEELI